MMMMRMKQMIKMVTWVKDGNGENDDMGKNGGNDDMGKNDGNDDMGKNGGRLLEARTQLVLTLMATGHWQQ